MQQQAQSVFSAKLHGQHQHGHRPGECGGFQHDEAGIAEKDGEPAKADNQYQTEPLHRFQPALFIVGIGSLKDADGDGGNGCRHHILRGGVHNEKQDDGGKVAKCFHGLRVWG